jgi:hypothetical protein
LLKKKNRVYRAIKKQNPTTQENGKNQEAKTGLQNPVSAVYLNSGTNLLS